jgi:hypothetical protein
LSGSGFGGSGFGGSGFGGGSIGLGGDMSFTTTGGSSGSLC